MPQFSVELSNPETAQRRSQLVSNRDGRFELSVVTPGPIRIAVIDPQRNVAVLTHELRPQQRLEGLRLQLPPQHASPERADPPLRRP